MKRKNLIFVSALLASQSMMAQTPYMNENYMPTDLIGSARYIGMGGALGALGADLSTASSNPAALGLYRRSDAALSFSVLTQQEKPDLNADMTHLSFDQMGFVVSIPEETEKKRVAMALEGLPKRPNRTSRLSLTLKYVSPRDCEITVEDLGFGEMYPSSGKIWRELVRWDEQEERKQA